METAGISTKSLNGVKNGNQGKVECVMAEQGQGSRDSEQCTEIF